MDKSKEFILWFDQLGIEDVPYTGGKNASLGEMYSNLTKKGVKIPNGFAVTAYSYRYFLEKAGIKNRIKEILKGLDTKSIDNLREKGEKVRQTILNAELPQDLKNAIVKAYSHLCKQYGEHTDVAVRSSATAEDLPDASFAGQQETYLNVKGDYELLESCKKCFASLFTNRAISYREDKHFDHFSIALSIGVQKMVRSDKACSGVMFSIDTESGFKEVVFITAAYGLGENVVQGAVNPDEYYVFKPTLKQGKKPIITKNVGEKKIQMIYCENGLKHTKNIPVSQEDRRKFVLSEDEVLQLAKWACIIEDHYSAKAGKFKPMDMEWAKDGISSELYIVQARPETVQSQKDKTKIKSYKLTQKGKVLVSGKSVGELIGQGQANILKDVRDMNNFKKGQVLVTDMTDPDWEPIMKIASGIVTNRGGRTCFPADTIVLTNQGFMKIKDIYENYEGLMVPSLNCETLKVEWKPVVASMKRNSNLIEVSISQTGNAKGNNLRLTPDHRMVTLENGEIISKEIIHLLKDEQMLSLIHKIPSLSTSTTNEQKLAYLLGALWTDGSIYQSDTHGEVQFIQKPTPEKESFISEVKSSMKDSFNYDFRVCHKKISSGFIRGKPAVGSANAYRCYSKIIAREIQLEKESYVKTLLCADEELVYSFLAGVIDGDGTYNPDSSRINIYCSNNQLLEAIVIGCLRIGILPQITTNRSIFNVQIVENIDRILSYTKRVKGVSGRKVQGTRFFSARQLLTGSLKGKFTRHLQENLLVDAEKLRRFVGNNPSLRKILDSDIRMNRVGFVREIEAQDVYNITVADNHNYIVFTDRLTPVLVNNCHAAIISRELGIPCIVGTNNGTEKVKQGQKITMDCASGEEGNVYDGLLKFKVEEIDLTKLPKTRTKIMMNVGNPDEAFELSFLPNEGVGLAREEFIINSYIKVHPMALINFNKIKDAEVKQKIEELTYGYKDKTQFFVDKLAQGVGMIAAAFYPKKVILRFSDFKTNEYANLLGGKEYEPHEENPMIGWRGASRYYKEGYRAGFALECQAIKKVREDFGLVNLEVMIPICRTIEEGKKVLSEMEKNGLKRGGNGLKVNVMCEVPSNAILADKFLEYFDGFSIGSNDLTQFTLACDRDSALVADIYDERNEAVKRLIENAIKVANAKHRYIGICGQAPSDYPEFAQFLVRAGIQSMSLNPDSIVKTTLAIAKTEKEMGIK